MCIAPQTLTGDMSIIRLEITNPRTHRLKIDHLNLVRRNQASQLCYHALLRVGTYLRYHQLIKAGLQHSDRLPAAGVCSSLGALANLWLLAYLYFIAQTTTCVQVVPLLPSLAETLMVLA